MRADESDDTVNDRAKKAQQVLHSVRQRIGGLSGPAGKEHRLAPTPYRGSVEIMPTPRSPLGRLAWSWVRHPVRSREYPAKRERLITAEEVHKFDA